jgi:hypothetical protein
MKRRANLLGILLLVSFALGGCVFHYDDPPPRERRSTVFPPSSTSTSTPPSEFGSSRYALSELAASMSAQSDGRVTRVFAALLRGAGHFIELDGGDSFTVRVGDGREIAMHQRRGAGLVPEIHYVAELPANVAPARYVVAFRRGSGKPGAPLSEVTVPGAFELSQTSRQARTGDPIFFTMTPAPPSLADVRLELEGSCVHAPTKLVPRATGDGRLLVDTTAIPLPAEGCTVHATVRHEGHGQVDSAFRRGVFGAIAEMEGLQSRAFDLWLGP